MNHSNTIQTLNVTEKDEALQLLGHIIDASINEIYIFDKESLRFTYVNKGAQRNLGYSLEEMKSMMPSDIKPEHSRASFIAVIKPLLDRHEEQLVFEAVHRRKDGSDYPVEVHLQLMQTKSQELFVAIILDITVRKQTEHRANHDDLTGLPNRTLFLDRLNQAINITHRANNTLAVMFIDLDHFKEINDTLGHQYGDTVLKEIAQRLTGAIRKTDTIARLGGDEFTLIIEGVTDSAVVIEVADKLMQAVKAPIIVKGQSLNVTLSIGIALYPGDGTSPQALLEHADAAMYKAKNEKRDTYRFYTEDITDAAFERIVMETGLRHALEHDEFIVYYQPQVDGRTDSIIGVEALVRWQHSKLGLLSPAQFIPLAKETGLMVRLDRWVMKIAMKQIVTWYEEGLSPGILSLNMTMKQLFEEDFISFLKATLKQTGCLPEWVELEMTEEQTMQDLQKAIKQLGEISNLGVYLAIDNFGTGNLSLTSLKRLPINRLKIDRSFIRTLPDNSENDTIVEAIIGLSKNMKMEIMAEGVETLEQKNFLLEHGCSRIQGYFCSKPISADEMKKVLKNPSIRC